MERFTSLDEKRAACIDFPSSGKAIAHGTVELASGCLRGTEYFTFRGADAADRARAFARRWVEDPAWVEGGNPGFRLA